MISNPNSFKAGSCGAGKQRERDFGSIREARS